MMINTAKNDGVAARFRQPSVKLCATDDPDIGIAFGRFSKAREFPESTSVA